MKLRDPKSLDEHDGRQDGYVSVDGDLVAVAEDGTFESERIDEQWARGYAERNGYDLSDVLVEESDSEEPEASTGHPTNDDGEPLCTGKDDGQCSRVVDEPGGVCWQHD